MLILLLIGFLSYLEEKNRIQRAIHNIPDQESASLAPQILDYYRTGSAWAKCKRVVRRFVPRFDEYFTAGNVFLFLMTLLGIFSIYSPLVALGHMADALFWQSIVVLSLVTITIGFSYLESFLKIHMR